MRRGVPKGKKKQQRAKEAKKDKGTIRGQGKPKDTVSRLFFQRNDHFAEVFNHTYFKEHPFSPEELEDQDSAEVASIRMRNGGSLKLQQYRDVCKLLRNEMFLMILGLENQTYIDPLMVFRILLLEVINYGRQIAIINDSHKGEAETGELVMTKFSPLDRLIPCQTVVVYYGKESWSAAGKLSDLFVEAPEGLKVNDWEITVIDVRRMTDEEIAQYGAEMKAFFSFIKYSEDPAGVLRVLNENEPTFKNLDEVTYDALTELTNSPELRKLREKKRTAEGGIDVCAGIKGLMEQSMEEGKIKTLWELVEQQEMTEERAAEKAHMSVTEFKNRAKAILKEEMVEYNPEPVTHRQRR